MARLQRPHRRQLLAWGLATAAHKSGCASNSGTNGSNTTASPPQTPELQTDSALHAKWLAALSGLNANVTKVVGFDRPVLIEGGGYPGIWLECGPHESLVYEPFAPEVAQASHDVFFAHQRGDGNLPCYIWKEKVGRSQIQMVVPIAATALEVANRGHSERFLQNAYQACLRWDEWLVAHRNTRGTGLCEIFCGYDTGHDNSPRFEGLPWACPEDEAANLPHVGALPYLGPDVSATMYGGRLALAEMARRLGRMNEEARWLEQAESLRKAIFRFCFDEEDACFYDRDANGEFVRIRHDALTRVMSEHVVDQKLFDQIWSRHLGNPQRFWTPVPFPSIAVDDPAFDKRLPHNSWGGASQALTALRTPRWMEHYGRKAALTSLMQAWLSALLAAPEFMQQANPWTGEMSTSKRYSPAMLVLLDFTTRLYGIQRQGDALNWNIRLPEDASRLNFRLPVPGGTAALVSHRDAAGGVVSELSIGRASYRFRGTARLITSLDGMLRELVGTDSSPQMIELRLGGRSMKYRIEPEASIPLADTAS